MSYRSIALQFQSKRTQTIIVIINNFLQSWTNQKKPKRIHL